jgi:hypothetical protein
VRQVTIAERRKSALEIRTAPQSTV